MNIGTYNREAQEGLLNALFKIATLIPGLALGVRGLHDINKSGWWLLMWLVFWLIIPLIVLLLWAAKHGDKETNRFGPVPKISGMKPDQFDVRHLLHITEQPFPRFLCSTIRQRTCS